MKRYPNIRPAARSLSWLALAAAIALPLPSRAAPVALATAPLANATTSSVRPNLMFILDNSGSMGQDYTPDYMSSYSVSVAGGGNPWTDDDWSYSSSNEKNCKDSADDDGSVSSAVTALDLCVVGDVPYMTSAMNSQYYNPEILYSPGYNADGTSKAGQTNPASVLTDGYNKQNKTQLNASTATINLTTSYPARVWCKNASDSPTGADCVRNNDYAYPNSTYKYGRSSGDVKGIYGAPYYYSVIPTEHCTAADLKTCTLSSVPTGAYTFPAKSRWCSDTNLTACQATKTSTYKYPRYAGASTTAVAAAGWARVGGTSKNKCFSSIKVNGIEILGATICWGNTENDADFAALLKNQINTYSSSPEYTAVINGSTSYQIDITSTSAAGATANGNITYTSTGTTLSMQSGTDITGGVTGITNPPYTFARTDIVPATATYPKVSARTDCSGAVGSSGCTYAEEVTNFGNWYAYYRTRMQGMKSAASRAFKPIDDRYRVGFITIANQSSTGNYLPIARFDNLASGSEATYQKSGWYTALFNISPSSSTPLRSALSTVGRIFAGKKPVGTADPMQYSCQQNFALLTTDGYWNTDTASSVKDISGNAIGNLDSNSGTRPMYEGPTATSATLADAAKYYYDTDLRTSALSNCTGSLGLDVCEDNVFISGTDNNVKQHMTTFTLGLGVDGTVTYSSDYKTVADLTAPPTDARLDYYNIVKGVGTPTGNWPVPVQNTETAVDDLWHAAINGQGTYFSAKDPAQLTTGLGEALASIGAKLGSAAAAATSTLNPVAGNNFAYVASYTTVKWQGNLEARTINVNTGVVSETATWCAENVVAGICSAPATIVADTSGASTIYNCVTPNATLPTCPDPGVLDGTDCKVQLPTACTGTMAAKVGVASDTRTIYTADSAGTSLINFDAAYATANPTNFAAAHINTLSQWPLLTATQQTAAAGVNLINFLRGQNGFEDRASNTSTNRLYRYREAVLGDALESQPFFISKPVFSYPYPGYSAFATANASRAGTVYMGANDGMMHAFDSSNGTERWAYVPGMVVPNMWKLADKNYATNHANFVNGSPIISDVCIAYCTNGATAVWKTILVGGLNGGGRGYYALDVTDPTAPDLLWEFTPTSDSDVGYSYGQAVITQKQDGTWVALVTSGYNNTGPGDGEGYLYVLNAYTGAVISKIGTNTGNTTTPSGLAKIAGWNDESAGNKVGYVYGGDLLGNVWRFDVNTASSPLLFATLKDASNNAQPITATPVLGKVDTKRVIYIGTGKYLETADLTNTQQQSLYAIQDDNVATTLTNPRASLVQQTITTAGSSRTVSENNVTYGGSVRGWYVDFPESGERVNIDGKLVLGTLLVPTIVPSNTVCSPGGYGWLNFFDFKTGKAVDTATDIASLKYDNTIVGINVLYIDGNPVVEVVTDNNPTPEKNDDVSFSTTASGFTGKRVIWRELIQ